MECRLFLAVHKLVLFARELKWWGKVYSKYSMNRDPERIRGLVKMRRPETISELIQFLQVANWMRLFLPNMVEVVAPLRGLMETRLNDTSRTKCVASRYAIVRDDWTPELAAAWQELLRHAVELNVWRPEEGRVLMFPDAGDNLGDCFLRQVPVADAASRKSVEKMEHEALVFLSGAFRGSQLNWPTVDK